jgi:hypothetical protein
MVSVRFLGGNQFSWREVRVGSLAIVFVLEFLLACSFNLIVLLAGCQGFHAAQVESS